MNQLTIPNILTLARMGLTVFFFSAGLQGDWPWALTLFLAAAVTDMIDGTIARVFHQKSVLGAFLDPAADKIMMLASVSLLTLSGTLPWWLMALIVGRDIYIVLGLFYLRSRQVKEARPNPTILSKLTTLSQIITIACGFVVVTQEAGYHVWEWIVPFSNALNYAVFAATLLTLITAIQYTYIGARLLRSSLEGTV